MSSVQIQQLRNAPAKTGDQLGEIIAYQKAESCERAAQTQALQDQIDRQSSRNDLLQSRLSIHERPGSCCHSSARANQRFESALAEVAASLNTLAAANRVNSQRDHSGGGHSVSHSPSHSPSAPLGRGVSGIGRNAYAFALSPHRHHRSLMVGGDLNLGLDLDRDLPQSYSRNVGLLL